MANLADLAPPLQRQSAASDTIVLKKLQLPYGIIAPDVWGQPKEQPALVSISLLLHGGFNSAAGSDRLDESTIHYGTLAKRIRASCKPNQSVEELSRGVDAAILEMGTKGTGDERHFIVAESTVEVLLPKASMYGEGVALISTTRYDRAGTAALSARTFFVHDLKIMTLVGVNSYERTQKQPLVASIWLHLQPGTHSLNSDLTSTLFKLERVLVETVQDTSFETLETLVEFTIAELRVKMLDLDVPGTRVQLRIAKPRAIAFADAPAVEVLRHVPFAKANQEVRNAVEPLDRLNVFKPYDRPTLLSQR